MAGFAVTATLALTGAVAAVSARTGPTTSEPTVQIERMVGAMTFRPMRMLTSVCQPGWAACELVRAAIVGACLARRPSPACGRLQRVTYSIPVVRHNG